MEISKISQQANVDSTKPARLILFIDDNPLVLETVKQLLEKSSFNLLAKDDPFDGLCGLVKNKPSAVFIDASMGAMSGYQFCALVKAQVNYQYIPLVMVLEYANDLEQAKAYAAGANAVLVKPFGKNELLKAMNFPGAQAA